jgi:hypothetical protein
MLPLAIPDKLAVEKFTAIVRIKAKQWHGQQIPYVPESLDNSFLCPIQEGKTLNPSCRYICNHQRMEKRPCSMVATMGNQVSLHKSRAGICPVSERAYFNLVL